MNDHIQKRKTYLKTGIFRSWWRSSSWVPMILLASLSSTECVPMLTLLRNLLNHSNQINLQLTGFWLWNLEWHDISSNFMIWMSSIWYLWGVGSENLMDARVDFVLASYGSLCAYLVVESDFWVKGVLVRFEWFKNFHMVFRKCLMHHFGQKLQGLEVKLLTSLKTMKLVT